MAEHRFETPQPVHFEIRIAAGRIRVSSVQGTESRVRLQGSPNLLESVRVELIRDRLIIEEHRRGLLGILGGIGNTLEIDAEIPDGSRIDVATASSSVRLDGSFARLDVKSASGDVRLDGRIEGDADLKTASGELELERVDGNLSVKTVSGDIAADMVGGSVAVKSVSAALRIGSIADGRVEVHSVSGDVTLGIAPGSAVDVDAGSASGRLSSEIPLSAEHEDGTGGPTVVIRANSVSGDLVIRRAVQSAAAS